MKKKIVLPLVIALMATSISAQTIAPFKKGDRVTFVGNSITHGGHYHSYIWLYYMTHFPKKPVWMANCGVGGDQAKETFARLEDDVLSKNPTVLTLTFGMNDSGYYEHNGDNAQQFANQKVAESREHFLKIEKKLQKEEKKGIRMVMLGTSPYDQTSTFNNDIFRKKNDCIQRIIAFQDSTARANNWEFLDFNAPMLKLNQEQQKKNPNFTIIGNDRIHPDNDGHLVMAYLFLQAQGLIGDKVADMEIDATTGKATRQEKCKVSKIKTTKEGLTFDYLAEALPYPLDTIAHGWGFTRGASQAVNVIPTLVDDLSDEHLTIKGLMGRYELKIDDIVLDTISSTELSQGINLSYYRQSPQYQQACAIMAMNEARWEIECRFREYAWLKYDFFMPLGLDDKMTEESTARIFRKEHANIFVSSKKDTFDKMIHPEVRQLYEDEMADIVDRIYKLNTPQKRHFSIKKL